jgi:hypothetical protein
LVYPELDVAGTATTGLAVGRGVGTGVFATVGLGKGVGVADGEVVGLFEACAASTTGVELGMGVVAGCGFEAAPITAKLNRLPTPISSFRPSVISHPLRLLAL